MKNKRVKIILIIVAVLLLITLIAMQFTDEVSWTIIDFIVMGVLLLSTGLLSEFILRKVTKIAYRILLFIIIFGAFLVIWAELAVGIF